MLRLKRQIYSGNSHPPAHLFPRVLLALLFARKYFSRISTPTFFNAGFTDVELLRCNQMACATGITAVHILAALITKLVIRIADLRGIWTACKIETMTTEQSAGGRYLIRRSCYDNWCFRRDCDTLKRGCAACDKYSENDHTNHRYI
jgi:hypothetical protein